MLLIVEVSQQIKHDVSGLTEQAGTDPSLRKAEQQQTVRTGQNTDTLFF